MRPLTARVLAAGALAALAGLAHPAEGGKVEVGKPAPDFTAPAVNVAKALPDKKDAKTIRLKDLKGKTVVLYFFPKALTPG
jgi:thioredoxin-dependent peroxiredoxin